MIKPTPLGWNPRDFSEMVESFTQAHQTMFPGLLRVRPAASQHQQQICQCGETTPTKTNESRGSKQ